MLLLQLADTRVGCKLRQKKRACPPYILDTGMGGRRVALWLKVAR